MAVTVYAEGMGLFHRGSGGKGVAPGDVCLTPPPPPGGPLPVPYVNLASASDLQKGSETVKADGEPTALEDHSEVSTSTGNEAGTQGGNVVTHKTSGKAYFELWSMTVKFEGKGVCRHGDMMGQNAGSKPVGALDKAALVKFKKKFRKRSKCARRYRRKGYGPTDKQTAHVKSKRCWVRIGRKRCNNFGVTADHQPPLIIAWYQGGCNDPQKFKKWARSNGAVRPQCHMHSRRKNPQKGFGRRFKAGSITAVMKKIVLFVK
ncbi:hypothetical protein AWB82_05609 [Caballeronia glebae]|jgi:uncharacterized Zn-binding protein involved in type VI secretion|uniref:Uncharacterized protein n=1 Tax=Caballeronia glebae TaxID=1777143 RepID=A0A158CMN4_9BURK|nr:DUF4150 domain-containing protein [Caballeronia glebae]SAK83653.1 hypothetical protein AWB82_05609 [Caballeronia glebae]